MLIHHQPEAGELLLSGTVGRLPTSADAEFYLRLLELNHARAIHRPGTLGVDRGAGTIVFLERWPLAGLSQEGFQQRLRSLLDGVKTWRELLKADGTSPWTAGGRGRAYRACVTAIDRR